MMTIRTELLAEIPYLNHADLAGRFISSLSFYDGGEWQIWLLGGEGSEQKLFRMQGWPAEGCYFARSPVETGDLYLPSFDFVGRIACFAELQKTVSAIQDDLLNLSTSLAKLAHLQSVKDRIPRGLSRMATTEVEYVVLVCRSLFDLFQEILLKLWDRVQLIDPAARKRRLKSSFARTMLVGEQPLAPFEIADRFGLPLQIAECYGRAADVFLALRRFRDNIVHHGSPVQHIFEGDGSFQIASKLGPLPEMVVWYDDERQPNDLVPLLPAIETLIYRTLATWDDFSLTISRLIGLPAPTVPDMHLYLRGYFTSVLVAALKSGAARSSNATIHDQTSER